MTPAPRRRRTSAGARTLGDELEHSFQGKVLGLARFYRWLVYHPPAGGKGGRVDREQEGAGFPDLTLVRAPRIIFAELKTRTGRIRPAQEVWLGELRKVSAAVDHASAPARHPEILRLTPSVEVYVWRPDDLQAIAGILAGAGMSAEAGLAFAAEHTPRGRGA